MKDTDCVHFLQWALPQLALRWPGFRKVRKQVCKRIQRRLAELQLADVDAYREHLATHPAEWELLDNLCRITISRFYRDRPFFKALALEILPQLAGQARASGEGALRLWSVGCASGEEPYTLSLLWEFELQELFADIDFRILATDLDPQLLTRARAALYPSGSLRDLPATWRAQAFRRQDDQFQLGEIYRRRVEFLEHDIRTDSPPGIYQVILCRNLVFTYYTAARQRDILRRLVSRLRPGGALVIGNRERLPAEIASLIPWSLPQGIYRLAK